MTDGQGKKERNRKSIKKMGPVKQKVLLLLLGGTALGLSGSPKTYFRVIKSIAEGWKEINRQSLRRAIRDLYSSHLIETKPAENGFTLILSEKGRKVALTYDLENMRISKPARWDGKWRIVMFDVPERKRTIRESLRLHLKQLGFHEFQKSVFIFPYDCRKEIEYLVEFYMARRFVRYITADEVDNALDLKDRFKLF